MITQALSGAVAAVAVGVSLLLLEEVNVRRTRSGAGGNSDSVEGVLILCAPLLLLLLSCVVKIKHPAAVRTDTH